MGKSNQDPQANLTVKSRSGPNPGLGALLLSAGRKVDYVGPFFEVGPSPDISALMRGRSFIHHRVIDHVAPIGAVARNRQHAEVLYERKVREFGDWRGRQTSSGIELSSVTLPLYDDRNRKLTRPFEVVSHEKDSAINRSALTHHVYDPVSDCWVRCGHFSLRKDFKESLIPVLLRQIADELKLNMEGVYEDHNWMSKFHVDAITSGSPLTSGKIDAVRVPVTFKSLSNTRYL